MAVMRLGDGRWSCRWRCFGGGGREEAGVRERKGGRSKVEKESFVCGGGGFCSLFPCALASLASTVCSRNTLGLSGERDHTQGARSPSLGLGASSLQKDGRRERERERGEGERECCFALDWFFNRTIESTQHCPSNTHRAFFMASKPPPRATAASSACWVSTATTKALPLLPPRRLLLLR